MYLNLYSPADTPLQNKILDFFWRNYRLQLVPSKNKKRRRKWKKKMIYLQEP